jgi:saccharopine dehydrogenase (NAD+, L-lysine-forming)
MKIGIIKEGKTPPDYRVPLSPSHCKEIIDNFPVELVVQRSKSRCFTDEEYLAKGITLVDSVADCDVLMGVKEVKIKDLIADKKYFFFSHTIKKQAYNKELLQEVLKKNIQLLDYEVLTNEKGSRIIAFGKFAGMVGAHNGIMAYGLKTGSYDLKRMNECADYEEAKAVYKNLKLPPVRIVLTGTGRVSNGAAEVLKDMNIKQVSPSEYLQQSFNGPVFTQISSLDYVKKKDESSFTKKEFYKNPENFKSNFLPFQQQSDILINGMYWDNSAPALFTINDLKENAFSLKVIADVTCDIAPVASVPTTIKASTIADPLFGFNKNTQEECSWKDDDAICMMTIDNLPNEMPRDASMSFGQQFVSFVLDELLKKDSPLIDRATIAKNGKLGPHFQYLSDYVS